MKELIDIQHELKAPKGQYNSFGKYKYRSCEDILESVKPLLKKYNCHLTIKDDVCLIGDRYYIKATATISNGQEEVSVSAFAREAESKKGMDEGQVTGATSSYARKYALNGLFCIDDAKDADTDAYKNQQDYAEKKTEELKNVQGKTKEPAKCESCGNLIEKITKKDGTEMIVAEVVQFSKKQYGRVLCEKCMKGVAGGK